jgi:hypothetical protein
MIYFPTTICDDFFDDPHGIVEISKRSNVVWESSAKGEWPGMRSQSLYHIDPHLFMFVIKKYLYTFFNKEEMEMVKFMISSVFQKINSKWGSGWVHNDFPKINTSIIYLTPNANPKSGTSLYTPKNINHKILNNEIKEKFYRGEISLDDAEPSRIEHNSQYEKDTTVYNRFNRLLGFDSQTYHAAEEFAGTEERLTLVTFIDQLSSPPTSYQRMKAFPLDRNDENL